MSFKLAEDFLLQRAYSKIWCTPEQDKQAIFKLARVTPDNGVWTHFTHQWRKIGLPVKRARFHVYQIGQVNPSILGLLNRRGGWVPVPIAMEQENIFVQVYNSRGRVVPRCLCWYLVTADNNLLLAVRKSEQSVDLTDIDMEREELFLRLYSNAYFNRFGALSNPGINVISRKVNSTQEIVAVQNEIANWPKVGAVICFVNGKAVSTVDAINTATGDYVDVVLDASIKYLVRYEVRTLREFNSTLDNLRKYLLTHDAATSTIDYVDDVDVYVTTNTDATRWHGTYLHKNDSRTMRQLTHRDWSVATTRVQGAAAANAHLKNKALSLYVYVRHSGYERELEMEHSRLFELYRLGAAERLDAMLGANAHVSVWRAEALEQSAYVSIMRAEQETITKDMVQEAYGYNALSVLLGDTPQRASVVGGQKVAFIPEGLRGCATVYEYSQDGKLLHYDSNTLDNTHGLRDSRAAIAEVVFGVASTNVDVQTGLAGTVLPEYNYRFYQADAVEGVRVGEWEDVTGKPAYLVTGSYYQWVRTTGKVYRVVSNKLFLGYSTRVQAIAGVIEFDLVRRTSSGLEKFDIPMGQLDLFINGYSLIENLDYVKRGARIVITSKAYLKRDDTGLEDVVVRYMSLAAQDMAAEPIAEASFVYNGRLSANGRYDIRKDKVLRIIVGGKLQLKSELAFAEDGMGAQIDNALNGAPYQIKDIIVPMNRYLVSVQGVEDQTYAMRAKSQAVDQEVSQYMTIKYPQQSPAPINAVPNRYALSSPFLSRIIDDLKTGVLWQETFTEHFGDDYVRKICKPYEPLLLSDPASGNFGVDLRYCVVHPHIEPTYVSLGMYQYRVVQRIRDLYLPQVDLSSHLNILQF